MHRVQKSSPCHKEGDIQITSMSAARIRRALHIQSEITLPHTDQQYIGYERNQEQKGTTVQEPSRQVRTKSELE